jgi:hypothetical protein
MRKRKVILDPSSYYRKRIASAIYKITGNQRSTDPDQDAVVLHVETRLKDHLNKIYRDLLKRKGKKRWSLNDVFSVLEDSQVYYGARRFLVVKRYSRKTLKKDTNPDDPDILVDDAKSLKSYDQELAALDDGTRLYKASERDRLETLKRADILTQYMDPSEYMLYHQNAQTKFIDPKDTVLFDQWMGWKKMGPDFYLVFGWLASNKIKRIIQNGLYNRRRHVMSPFTPNWILYDKMNPLSLHDFAVSTRDVKSRQRADELEQQQFDEEFYKVNDVFRDPIRATYSFSILNVLQRYLGKQGKMVRRTDMIHANHAT